MPLSKGILRLKRKQSLRTLLLLVVLLTTLVMIVERHALAGLYLSRGLSKRKNESPREPIWPEDAPNSDRIEEQIRFRPSKLAGDILLVSLFEGHSTWNMPDGEAHKSLFINCPVNNCRASHHIEDVEKANAILFRSVAPRLPNRRPDQIVIFSSLEAPPHVSLKNYENMVNWTATYRRDSDIVTPYGKFGRTTGKEGVLVDLETKTHLAAWFVSHCHTLSKREDYVKELKKYMKVDQYGSCNQNSECHRGDPGCWRLLEKYRFYFAFENCRCRDYFTEKLFGNAIQHGVVPVVLGPPRWQYDQVMPPGSFIHVEDFASPKDLAKYLRALATNDTAYSSFFSWKKHYELLDTLFWCRLCAMLNEPRAKVYKSLKGWWNPPGTCQYDRFWT